MAFGGEDMTFVAGDEIVGIGRFGHGKQVIVGRSMSHGLKFRDLLIGRPQEEGLVRPGIEQLCRRTGSLRQLSRGHGRDPL